jgi:hypothetical protein
MVGLKSLNELRAATQDSLLDFLRVDLAMCSTFLDLAEIDLPSDDQRALEAFSRAERGCEAIEHFRLLVEDPKQQLEIEEELHPLQF